MDGEHLEPFAREALALTAEQRIDFLRHPRWVGYQRAREILDQLEAALRHPKVQRMPNLMLVGETNNGKTMLASRFVRQHSGSADGKRTVLMVQAPPVPDENRFYAGILEALNAPYRPQETAARRHVQVLRLLRGVGLRMLVIDEIHHILAGHYAKQRRFLNVLKYLGNDLQIPLVGVGTLDALRAVQTEPQVASRFDPIALSRWQWSKEFLVLLASFERVLPLRERSHLIAEPLARKLLSWSEGMIGELSRLLNRAAETAIRKGTERIDEQVLAATEWVRPCERRQQAERLV